MDEPGQKPAEPDQGVRLGDIKCTDPNCPDRREGKSHAHLKGVPWFVASERDHLEAAFPER